MSTLTSGTDGGSSLNLKLQKGKIGLYAEQSSSEGMASPGLARSPNSTAISTHTSPFLFHSSASSPAHYSAWSVAFVLFSYTHSTVPVHADLPTLGLHEESPASTIKCAPEGNPKLSETDGCHIGQIALEGDDNLTLSVGALSLYTAVRG